VPVSNGASYSGATTNTLTVIRPTSALTNKQYEVIFTNAYGSLTSGAATLTVDTVTTQPSNQAPNAGQDATFTAASALPTDAVQWYVSTNDGISFAPVSNGASYSGATTGRLTVTASPSALNNYQYKAIFTNAAGSFATTAAKLTVMDVITIPPKNQTINLGQNATFTAASGYDTDTVQWWVSSGGSFTPLSNDSVYSGVTTRTLTITLPTISLNTNQYEAVFTPLSTTPAASRPLTSTPASLTVDWITTQPVNQRFEVGQPVAFTAASSLAGDSVQWKISTDGGATYQPLTNNGQYSGVTMSTLVVSGTTADMAANEYEAVFSNAYGTLTSTPAALVPVKPGEHISPPPPTVSFASAFTSAPDSRSWHVPVTLFPPSSKTVTVDYAVTGGTATGNAVDYFLPPGTLTFQPGEITKNILVILVGDTLPEPDKTIQITLSQPNNALLGATSVHTFTITHNSEASQLPAPRFLDSTAINALEDHGDWVRILGTDLKYLENKHDPIPLITTPGLIVPHWSLVPAGAYAAVRPHDPSDPYDSRRDPDHALLNGIVVYSHAAYADTPWDHVSVDRNFFVHPDAAYQPLLSHPANFFSEDGDPSSTEAGRIEVEWEQTSMPAWALPNQGDRVHVEGALIYDQGHGEKGFRSEIHPPRLLMTIRDAAEGSWGGFSGDQRPGWAANIPGAPGFGEIQTTRADLYASSDGGLARNQIANFQHVAPNGGSYQDLADRNYHLFIPAPPSRGDGYNLLYTVKDMPLPNGMEAVPDYRIRYTQATDGQGQPTGYYVDINFDGYVEPSTSDPHNFDKYGIGKSINVYWDKPADLPVKHVWVKFDAYHADASTDFIQSGDEWSVTAMVGDHFEYLGGRHQQTDYMGQQYIPAVTRGYNFPFVSHNVFEVALLPGQPLRFSARLVENDSPFNGLNDDVFSPQLGAVEIIRTAKQNWGIGESLWVNFGKETAAGTDDLFEDKISHPGRTTWGRIHYTISDTPPAPTNDSGSTLSILAQAVLALTHQFESFVNQTVVTGAVSFIVGEINNFVEFGEAFKTAIDSVPVLRKLAHAVYSFGKDLPKAANIVFHFAKALFDEAGEALPKVADALVNGIEDAAKDLPKLVQALFDNTEEAGKDLGKLAKALWNSGIRNTRNEFQALGDVADALWDKAGKNVSTLFHALVGNATPSHLDGPALASMAHALANAGGFDIRKLGDIGSSLWDQAGRNVGKLFDALLGNATPPRLDPDTLGRMAGALAHAGGSLDLSRLGTIAQTLWDQAGRDVGKLFNALVGNATPPRLDAGTLGRLASALANAAGSFDLGKLGSIAQTLWNQAEGNIGKLFNALLGNATPPRLDADTLGKMASALANAAGSFDLGKLGTIAQTLWNQAEGNIGKLFNALLGNATPPHLDADTLGKMASALANAAGSLDLGKLGTIAQTLWNEAGQNIATLFNALVGNATPPRLDASTLGSMASALAHAGGAINLDRIINIAQSLWEQAGRSVPTLGTALWGNVTTDVLDFARALGNVSREIGEIARKVWDFCGNELGKLANALWSIDWAQQLSQLAKGLRAVTGEIGDIARQVWEFAAHHLDQLANALWGNAVTDPASLAKGLKAVVGDLIEIAKQVWNFCENSLGKLVSALWHNVVSDFIDFAKALWHSGAHFGGLDLVKIMHNLGARPQDLLNALRDIVRAGPLEIIDALQRALNWTYLEAAKFIGYIAHSLPQIPPPGGFVGQTLKRWGVNGYMEAGIAFFDANKNGILDPNEPWAFTDPQGGFEIGVPASFDTDHDGVLDDSEGQWVVEGGLDTTTGFAMVASMIAPATWRAITPLTTLVSTIANTTGATIAVAKSKVLLAMGLSPQLDLANFDPIAGTLAANADGPLVFGAHALVQDTIAEVAGLFRTPYNAPPTRALMNRIEADLAGVIATTTSPIDFSNQSTIAAFIQKVETSTGVTLNSNLVAGTARVIAATNQQVYAIARAATFRYLADVVKVKTVSQGAVADDLASAAAGPVSIDTVVSRDTGATLAAKIAATATPPIIQVPLDITAEATGATGARVSFVVQANDIAGRSLTTTSNPSSGSLFPLGVTTVTSSATDSLGNTVSVRFKVQVVDTTPPTLSLPANLVIEANTAGGANVTLPAVRATDLVDPNPRVSVDHASGFFPLGITLVTATATDASGNTSTGSFTVTVMATTPPALSLPANLVIEANTTGGANVTLPQATATGVADPHPLVTQDRISGFFPIGTTIVHVTAKDAYGNRSTGTFTVKVVATTPPTLSLPANLVVEANTTGGATVTLPTATATDVADPSPTVTQDRASGFFPAGTTVVHVTAKDAYGNTSTGSFTVKVMATTPPTIALPQDLIVNSNTTGGANVTLSQATATSIADPHPVVTQDRASGFFLIGTTVIHVTAKDAYGNSSAGSFTVTVVNRTPPTLTVPHDVTVEANVQGGGAQVTLPKARATDADDPDPVITYVPASGFFPMGVTTVKVTATNVFGKASTGSFTVTVVDTTPPTLSLPADVVVQVNTVGGAMVTLPKATATDLVDPHPVITYDHSSGFFPVGTTRITVTATDASGNFSLGTFTVTVKRGGTTTTLAANSPQSVTYGDSVSFTVTVSSAAGGSVPNGETVTLIDASNGNALLATATLSAGSARITLPRLNAGAHTIFAYYGGDNNNAAGQSGAVTQVVNKKALYIRAITNTKVYDGNTNAAPVPVVTGLMGSDTVTGLTETFDTPHAGTGKTLSVATYTVSDGNFGNNYAVTTVTNVTGEIDPAPLTITADNKSKAYGAALPVLTARYGGFINGETVASLQTLPVLATVPATSHVGSYDITASGAVATDYQFRYVKGTLTITPVPLTITADNKTKVYGQPNPLLTATYAGLVNGDTPVSLTKIPSLTTAPASSPIGRYDIVAAGAVDADYTIAYVKGTLTVTPAPLTITADNKGKIYGAALPVLTASYSGLVNGDTATSLSTPPTLSTTATAASGVGTYVITASGAASPNYTISYVAGTLTVTRAALTVTADNQTKVYGQPNPPLTASYSGFVNGDTAARLTTPVVLTTTATTGSGVGSHPITASGATSPNYTISYVNGVLTVTRAALTITPENKTKVYGQANPPLTASYTGLVNGDTATSLSTPPTLSTPATTASGVGTYAITASGAAAANYAISYVAGTLTVTRAALTVTADNQTKVYGQANPPLTASYSGFVNGDTAANLTSPATLSTTATTASPTGGYPITVSGATSPNYTLTFVNGTLAVTKAPLLIRADDQIKFYGDPVPALTATFLGLVNGDTPASLPNPVVLTTPATATSSVGSYPIHASEAGSPNYAVTFADGTLLIPAILTLDFPTATTAGVAVTVTVRAVDETGSPIPSYRGTVRFSSSDPQALLPADYTFQDGDNGVATLTATLGTAGSQSLTVTDRVTGSTITQANIVVDAAAADHFTLTAPATTAGSPFTLVVTARDPFGNIDTRYSGTVSFTSSDGAAVLPADYTFQPSDVGQHSFRGVALFQAGSSSMAANDAANGLGGSTVVPVAAAAADHFDVAAPSGSTAGTAFAVTVTARDPYGNIDTGYRGTVSFSSSDGRAVLPANYLFTAGDQGVHTFPTVTLFQAGPQNVTVFDRAGGQTGTACLSVTAAAADHFVLAVDSTLVSTGVAFDVTVAAVDAYGNIDTTYQGTVSFTSTDQADGVALPAAYTFGADDGGRHTFALGCTLITIGDEDITATDRSHGLTGRLTVNVS
jgi:hypothetical protein